MKVANFFNYVNSKVFGLSLLVSTVLYFSLTRHFQDSLIYSNSDMRDALPGFPVTPEPYEIPLYLLGYVAIPVIALGIYAIIDAIAYIFPGFRLLTPNRLPDTQNESSSQQCFGNKRKLILWAIGCLVGLGIIIALVYYTSAYDFVGSYFARRSVWHLLWLLLTKRLYIIRLSLVFGVFAFVYLYFFQRPHTSWLDFFKKILYSKKVSSWVPYFFIFLVILIIHPNFPSEENYINYILSPAHETQLGKPLLYETTSVYGVLNVYFAALVMGRILPFTYEAFVLVLALFYILFYLGLFKSLLLWMNSVWIALVGTWTAVVFGYLLLQDPVITPFNFPGQTAYRQGFYILTLLAFSLFWSYRKRWLKDLTFFCAAISLFWNIDTGVYVSIATFSTFAYIELTKFQTTVTKRIVNVAINGIHQLAYILCVFLIISVVNFSIFNAWPDWLMQIRDVSTFKTGYGRFPIPAVGLFLVHVFVYVNFSLWLLKRFVLKKQAHPTVVFLTVFGIFSFLYYIGTSAWTYMNFTSIPMAMLLLFSFSEYIRSENQVFSKRFVLSLFCALTVFLCVLSAAKVPVVFAYRDYTQFNLFDVKPEDRGLYEDAQYIRANIPETRIPLFHHDDGKLLIMANKVNMFFLQENNDRLYSLYDDFLVIYKRHIQGLKNQIDEFKPDHVLISNTPDARMQELIDYISASYFLETKLQTLNVYKRNP